MVNKQLRDKLDVEGKYEEMRGLVEKCREEEDLRRGQIRAKDSEIDQLKHTIANLQRAMSQTGEESETYIRQRDQRHLEDLSRI